MHVELCCLQKNNEENEKNKVSLNVLQCAYTQTHTQSTN